MKEEKFIAIWCEAMVMVSNLLINKVTAEKILVSKKIEKPIGTPLVRFLLFFLSDTICNPRKIWKCAKGFCL